LGKDYRREQKFHDSRQKFHMKILYPSVESSPLFDGIVFLNKLCWFINIRKT